MITFWGSTLHVTLAFSFINLSQRGCGPLTVYESSEQALGQRPRSQGGVGWGLAITPSVLRPKPTTKPPHENHVYVLEHVGK